MSRLSIIKLKRSKTFSIFIFIATESAIPRWQGREQWQFSPGAPDIVQSVESLSAIV
jgi:hypothetical protein